jgi:hypothetical protein
VERPRDEHRARKRQTGEKAARHEGRKSEGKRRKEETEGKILSRRNRQRGTELLRYRDREAVKNKSGRV